MSYYGKTKDQGKKLMKAHEKGALGIWWAQDDMWSTPKQYKNIHEGTFHKLANPQDH